ncbi:MAG: PRC-barrel domain-containing protein [Sedimentisphaerales bacterium]|jgi:hypothetical protein
MLRSVKSLVGYRIGAEDGMIGKVEDFLFHETSWIVRYLVVDTSSWLLGRKVLISPASLEPPVAEFRMVPVHLTREQVKSSPDIDTERPISRQAEMELHEHYDWTPYWISGGLGAPAVVPSSEQKKRASVAAKEKSESDLRSAEEVIGYRIHAIDGHIGHADDFVIEDGSWIIRYLVVATTNWLPGRKVLIAPQWIEQINWIDSKIHLDLLADQVKDSPRYDPFAPVNQEYETRLYDYYGRPKYWT